jgi:hypothetical protein
MSRADPDYLFPLTLEAEVGNPIPFDSEGEGLREILRREKIGARNRYLGILSSWSYS